MLQPGTVTKANRNIGQFLAGCQTLKHIVIYNTQERVSVLCISLASKLIQEIRIGGNGYTFLLKKNAELQCCHKLVVEITVYLKLLVFFRKRIQCNSIKFYINCVKHSMYTSYKINTAQFHNNGSNNYRINIFNNTTKYKNVF